MQGACSQRQAGTGPRPAQAQASDLWQLRLWLGRRHKVTSRLRCCRQRAGAGPEHQRLKAGRSGHARIERRIAWAHLLSRRLLVGLHLEALSHLQRLRRPRRGDGSARTSACLLVGPPLPLPLGLASLGSPQQGRLGACLLVGDGGANVTRFPPRTVYHHENIMHAQGGVQHTPARR